MLVSMAVLIAAAILSGILCSFIPRFSVNYISIIIGILIALITPLNKLVAPFHSEIFMYIVAPLIYFEGQSTSINLVGRGFKRIIETAVLLVIVGMVVSGFSLTLLGLPIAFAFLMGALSTPTDATATESVAEGLIIPERQYTFLKMESLFNDASGIILIGATALWVEKGQLNFQQTILAFLCSAIGGLIIGAFFATVIISFRQLLGRFNSSAYNAQTLIFVVTPFLIYFIAEELRVSGIIAVVCAGLMQNSESVRSRFITPRQYHNGIVVMNLIREIFNSIVFVILGILIVRNVHDDLIIGDTSIQWLEIGIILYIVNLIIRIIYGLVTNMKWRGSLIFALGGVHGAVTLALVYTIIDSVSRERFKTVILAETFVIILSMIIPTIIFRFMLPHALSIKEQGKEITRLRSEMVDVGLKAVEKIYLPPQIRESVLYDLRDQKNANSFHDFWRQWVKTSKRPPFNSQERELEQRALLWAFYSERQYLDMISQKEKRPEYLYELYNDVLLAESIVIDPDNNVS